MSLSRRKLFAAAPLGLAAASLLQDPDRPAATMHTRFAANIEMWWRDRPLLERIRAAHRLGFPAIEMWPWRGKDLDAIAALTRELGLELTQFTAWGFDPPLNDPANHDRLEREIAAACGAAAVLRTKMMTVLAGNDRPGVSQAEMHEHVIAGLERAARIAEDHDVTLILEPLNIRVDHAGHCLSRSDDALRICRQVDSTHVKINWDLYHLQITEGDLCGHLRGGFEHIGYVQLADHPGRTEPGTGEIHYNRVLRELWDLGYRGFVGVECRPVGTELEAARALARADVW